MKRLAVTIAMLFWALASSLCARNIYILSAGVADYPGTVNDLILPARDAREMYRLYIKHQNATAILLTDANATRGHILSEAGRLFKKAGPDDIVIFFFSGHGSPGGFYAYDEKVSYDEIRKLFATCKARSKMIFADACFAGDMREGGRTGKQDGKSDVMLFLSCRTDEYSIEKPSMKNGIFTACLLRSLKGAADTDKDRIITAKELFNSVSKGVAQLSGDRQHPVMWGNFKDTMPVMIWK